MVCGPFLRDRQTTSPGDARFHASLRSQNPAVGDKDLGDISGLLATAGLRRVTKGMPASNLMLIAFKN